MSEIPEEVMKICLELAEKVGDNQPAYYDGSAEFEEANKENALLIAEVIMAERERCAAIAKDNCDSDIAELILGKAGVA